MTFKIKEDEIELVYSFRSAIYYESIAGKNLDFDNFSANDLITLFYAVIVATLQKKKMPTITMLDFLDYVDDNGGDKCIMKFTNWYIDNLRAQYEIEEPKEEKKEKQKSKVSSKKKVS